MELISDILAQFHFSFWDVMQYSNIGSNYIIDPVHTQSVVSFQEKKNFLILSGHSFRSKKLKERKKFEISPRETSARKN